MGKISMPQGRGNLAHNRRDYAEMPEHIDKSRMADNVTVVDRDIREVYEELFGDAVREFNSRQTHADRRIDDYYEHIRQSKQAKGQKQVMYEDVVQWGKKEDFNNPETRQTAKEALWEYASTWQERNPNLRLVGAYIHMDEASPHLHIDYVPVGHYSRGLKTKNALDKAMREMGIEPRGEGAKGNATQCWKERERAYFGDICRAKGLRVDAEEQSTRKNLSVNEYKDARDRMRQTAKKSVQKEMAQLKYTERQKIQQQWDVLNSRETALNARESDLVALDAQLRTKQQKLLKTQNTLSERVSALKEREQAVAEREQHQKSTQIDIERQQQDLTKRLNKAIIVDKGLNRKYKDIMVSTDKLEHIKADNQQVLDGITSATDTLRQLMDKGLRLTATQKRDLHERIERHKPLTPTSAPALERDVREFMDGLDSLQQDKGGQSL